MTKLSKFSFGTALINRFSINLRLVRRAQGLTQAELARRSKISRACVNMVENGVGQPSLATVGQLAAGLDVDPRVLLAPVRRTG